MSEDWRERMGHYRTPAGAAAYREKHRRTSDWRDPSQLTKAALMSLHEDVFVNS